MPRKSILVAPLNWGLGHATRCVPIIHKLLAQDFEVVLASDGLAYHFLKKEFPHLSIYQLAPLHVVYAEKRQLQSFNMMKQIPKLYQFIKEDKIAIKKLSKQIQLDGIISDNRPGVYLDEIPSVYVNHQLNVKTGLSTQLSSALHQQQMKNFDAIWVPDVKDEPSLSGELGHLKTSKKLPPISYLGWLSRLNKEKSPIEYDYCAVISGPEPQRTLFENRIAQLFQNLSGKKICITGNVGLAKASTSFEKRAMLNSTELNAVISASKIVICRSGYTSLMDLLKMQKPALLVPTPGQFEQEYLAKRMQQLKWFSVCNQDEFIQNAAEKLKTVQHNKPPAFQELKLDFSVFKRDFE
jgi:predicted glycosyltransferase